MALPPSSPIQLPPLPREVCRGGGGDGSSLFSWMHSHGGGDNDDDDDVNGSQHRRHGMHVGIRNRLALSTSCEEFELEGLRGVDEGESSAGSVVGECKWRLAIANLDWVLITSATATSWTCVPLHLPPGRTARAITFISALNAQLMAVADDKGGLAVITVGAVLCYEPGLLPRGEPALRIADVPLNAENDGGILVVGASTVALVPAFAVAAAHAAAKNKSAMPRLARYLWRVPSALPIADAVLVWRGAAPDSPADVLRNRFYRGAGAGAAAATSHSESVDDLVADAERFFTEEVNEDQGKSTLGTAGVLVAACAQSAPDATLACFSLPVYAGQLSEPEEPDGGGANNSGTHTSDGNGGGGFFAIKAGTSLLNAGGRAINFLADRSRTVATAVSFAKDAAAAIQESTDASPAARVLSSFADARRRAWCIAASASGRIAAMADNLGRVCLIDTATAVSIGLPAIYRIFKGARDAQCVVVGEKRVAILLPKLRQVQVHLASADQSKAAELTTDGVSSDAILLAHGEHVFIVDTHESHVKQVM